jgi:hypothetical protein
MFHAATVTLPELELLRRVRRFVRGQRVRRIEPERVILDRDAIATDRNELYVDCTARALGGNVNDRRPVFTPGLIRLQMLRQYQPTFSASLIGHIEASIADEAEKQKLAQVAPMTDTVEDWVAMMIASMTNQGNWGSNKELSNWMANCRLDLYSGQVRRVRPDETSKQNIMIRIRENAGPAVRNLHKLLQAAR